MHPTQPIPGGDQSNPYDFILNGPPKKKRNLLPKGESKKQRLIILIGIGLALLTVFIVIFSLIFGGGGDLSNLEKTAKEQQEIIRVAGLGEKGARSSDVQSLAISTKLAVTSSQKQVLSYLNERGKKLKDKDLSSKINLATDKELQAAADSGTYDDVFTAILTTHLDTYMQNLARYYDETGSNKQKQVLQDAYNQANGLIEETPAEDNAP